MDAGEQAPALSPQAEKENIILAAPSQPHPHPAAPQARPLCRFYSQGRHCHWGKRCRFLHQRSQADGAKQALSTLENKPSIGADSQPDEGQGPGELQPVAGAQDTARQETCQASRAFRSGQSREQMQHKQPQQQQHHHHHHQQRPQHDKQQQHQQNQHQQNQEKPQQQQHQRQQQPRQPQNRRPCRYFLSGFCAMEDRCRFAHPERFPPVTDQHPQPPPSTETNNLRANHVRPSPRPRAPVARPQPQGQQQEVKLSDLTEELAKQLRSTEIQQLTKRFPKEKLIVQEREDGKVTYYRATVQPTDPDWPFDLKDLDIMVSFPDNYPQEVFTIEIPLDQDLPSVMGRHVQQASTEWLQAKHATNQLMGKVELLFRPFLRWLDRSMERLFTEGARKLKKDVEAERAGIQFVPYEQLQAAVLKDSQSSSASGPDPAAPPSAATAGAEQGGLDRDEAGAGSDGDEEDEDDEDGEDEYEEDEEGNSRKVENVKSGERRKGTEVKLLGLRLGEGTATVVARQLTVSLQCSRCKVASDLTLSGRLACTAQCEKCGAGISAAFRPSMLHAYSDVLGYLDLNGVLPVDLVLQEAELAVGCLNCSQEDTVQNVAYGQNKETNCQQCHSKLSIFVESTRFQLIQPHTRKPAGQGSTQPFRRHRDPAIQGGKPLPDKGACKHYKQSHRWLRFPCCGRAYPCDLCHDEDQDHPMELATRMICGHCAKEQPFSNGRPCVSCGGMMTRAAHSSFWEGGLGCRNRVKMNRNDRQKYANTNKTISRKATAAKK